MLADFHTRFSCLKYNVNVNTKINKLFFSGIYIFTSLQNGIEFPIT